MTEPYVCKCGDGHANYGDCIRAKGIRFAYCNSDAGRDATLVKNNFRELHEYEEARRQGV